MLVVVAERRNECDFVRQSVQELGQKKHIILEYVPDRLRDETSLCPLNKGLKNKETYSHNLS